MSGIEVVGLILGSVPLIVSGMEHYADGVSTLGRYRRYKLELKMLTNILETEKMKLRCACEKLLIGLVPFSKIDELIEDPFGETWRDEAIQKRIRVRLWESFTAFENTVKDVYAAIQEMISRLGLQPDGKVKWIEGSAFRRELKRATFSLKKASYDDLLARIKDGIASLVTLTTQNVELEPKRKMRSQGRLFSLLREISKSIYRALKNSLVCQGTHDLNLQLAARSADFTSLDEDEKITKEFSFMIAISSHIAPDSDNQLIEKVQFWDEVVIKETTASTRVAMALPSHNLNPAKKGKRKAVSFMRPQSTTTTVTSNASTVVLTQVQPSSATPVPAMVNLALDATLGTPEKLLPLPINLCDTLRKAKKQPVQQCYGHIVDSTGTSRREYGIYPLEKAIDGEKRSTVSLRQVLESPPGKLPPLTYRDRVRLAVVISSSVIQLHHTPWLPDRLRSEDIVFIQRDNAPLYEHAFVVKRVPDRDHTTAASPTKASVWYNPTMLSLGILLIELVLGKPVHETAASGKLESDILSDYDAAQPLLHKVEQMAGSNYGSAVRRCLHCHTYEYDLSLENEGFRHDVYSGVVALLGQDLEKCC
ncbi:hypothetical protein QBC46DRAFT_5330 [Diplogelasinospora grovesii]|uniref:DUF7580 domain-containing protein n=1 Tax=Diplogelasinospora grovesii TaxID=303347 RepID=A0AAN6SAF0_9PEZI|nr:hypothetical protein QBC46DRAFT_5330 [Diplogelasinospora grovesii]